MRRLVPPRDVSRQALCVHMHPETLGAVGDEQFGVRFTVDSLTPLLPPGTRPSAAAASASSVASSSAAEGLMSGSLVEIAERPAVFTSSGGGSGLVTGSPTGNRELFAAGDCKLRSSPGRCQQTLASAVRLLLMAVWITAGWD